MDTIDITKPVINPVIEAVQEQQSSKKTLQESVKKVTDEYLVGKTPNEVRDVYNMILAEVEVPLLETIMKFVKGNQSKAAIVMGLSRGTLRKKLKIYGFLE